MKTAIGIGIVLRVLSLTATVQSKRRAAAGGHLTGILLGTAGDPTINPERSGSVRSSWLDPNSCSSMQVVD